MAMARHDLTAVETALLQAPGGADKCSDEFLDRFLVQRMRGLPMVRLADGGGGVHPFPADVAPAAPSAMRDLRDTWNAVAMDRGGKRLQMRNDAILKKLHAIPIPCRT